MKLNRVILGVLLFFIGSVLLLENFNVIDFYWSAIWDFWPIFLIILGLNFLFNKKDSNAGNIISLSVLIVSLVALFIVGQHQSTSKTWRDDDDISFDTEGVEDSTDNAKFYFSEPFLSTDSSKKAILNLSGGGISFNLNDSTDSLISAMVTKNNKAGFSLTKLSADSANTLTFGMQNKKNRWSGSGNDVDLKLNTFPIWEINLKMGAGEANFDLTPYKVRTLNFDGGAASVDVKLSDLLPITDVNVKTGMADVNIKIPKLAGCQIKTKTGLSNKDFTGFTKISEGVYETPNYKTAPKKIFIKFDGGLSNFEVDRY